MCKKLKIIGEEYFKFDPKSYVESALREIGIGIANAKYNFREFSNYCGYGGVPKENANPNLCVKARDHLSNAIGDISRSLSEINMIKRFAEELGDGMRVSELEKNAKSILKEIEKACKKCNKCFYNKIKRYLS